MKTFFLALCLLGSTLFAEAKLIRINLVDRNGMTETISDKTRLSQYQKVDFLSSQPYQKVFRLFERDSKGNAYALITSYHPNGELKQYLECCNNRAYGCYREWHPNGQLKIDATLISGSADLSEQAEASFLFDGTNYAYDESGHLVAEIPYFKGELHGDANYYHTNGSLWKKVPYVNNALHGTIAVYLEDGTPFQFTEYANGEKNGQSTRYWEGKKIAFQENYKAGLLEEGRYYDQRGSLVCSVTNFQGWRASFGKENVQELHEVQGGIEEGVIKILDDSQHIIATYAIKDGEKEGQEIRYFPKSSSPRLLLSWHEGVLQGPIKTWYDNGIMESVKEMNNNKRNGAFTAWYKNGSLHFVEEYDNDKLISGEYYRMKEQTPTSRVEKGRGTATLFDAEGNFSKKIRYYDGKPTE